MTPEYPEQPEEIPSKKKYGKLILGSCTAVAALLGFIIASSTGGHTTIKDVPGPAVTVTAPAPAVTRTAHVTVTQTATVQPAPLVSEKFSGSGDWNSPEFTLNGNAVVVTYSYSGNIMSGEIQGDNFIADIESSSDDQSIANTIGSSGSATTNIYPDTTSPAPYHLSVQATGSWSFTITESGS
jgi:hypothetical protein